MTESDTQEEYLFVSYSRADSLSVKKIVFRLRNLGVNFWIDTQRNLAGDVWERNLFNALDNCRGVLLFISRRSMASQWVKREFDYALQHGKPIIPILLEPAEGNTFKQVTDDIQYADFKDIDDNQKFINAIYVLVRSVCKNVTLSNCNSILDESRQLIGSDSTMNALEEIELKRELAHKWIREVRDEYKQPVMEWRQNTTLEAQQTAERLKNYALGVEVQAPDVMRDAAQAIAQSGNAGAVAQLVGWVDIDSQSALKALQIVWEKRPHGIPGKYLGKAAFRVRRFITWQQLTRPAAWFELASAIVAMSLAIMFTLYIEFDDPQGLFPLTQLSNVLSNGVAYGLFAGVGIAAAYFFIPRLRILGWVRFPVAFIFGWMLTVLVFVVFNTLFYLQVPTTWNPVLGLSSLLVTGFAVSNLLQPTNIVWTVLRAGIAFSGVAASQSIPCSWSILPVRLLFFTDDCLAKALIVALFIVAITFAPEVISHLQRSTRWERGRADID